MLNKSLNPEKNIWHDGGVVYQIYPRSFMDGNGDGVGDLPGIVSRLDYLNGREDSLGVDAIWLSPFYKSPMADGGYDISDYCDVDPQFGTIEDFKRLVQEANARNIEVFVDLVPNHTSDEHPWFIESRASRGDDNPKRDWYIWRDARENGEVPNNWLSTFPLRIYDEASQSWRITPQSAWSYDETRGQYYLHSFSDRQPDLNWANPEVREAMKDMMRFWLDLGVAGFRVDVADQLGKHPEFLDEPNENERIYSKNHPRLFDYLREMTTVLGEYDGKFMVTEVHVDRRDPLHNYLQFYEQVDPRYCMPFNFEGLKLPWKADVQQQSIDQYLAAIKSDYVPNFVLGNHDISRVASRIGHGAARAAAVLQLTLPGTAFIYYGEEGGFEDVEVPPNMIDDPYDGRDPERTPMLWDNSRNAGFSDAEQTWLPIAPYYRDININAQSQNPHSFLALYKALIKLRKSSPAIRYGTYQSFDTQNAEVLGFTRQHDDQCWMVLVNFSGEKQAVPIGKSGQLVLSSTLQTSDDSVASNLELKPHEALIIQLNNEVD